MATSPKTKEPSPPSSSEPSIKEPPVETMAKKHTTIVRTMSRVAGMAIVLVLAAGLLAYVLTPSAIRNPAFQHYHFRMQVIANGKAVNFGNKTFQEGYTKDNCNAELTARPFHFHDNRDQLAHVHWDQMTGGLLLKYYGWNYVGGVSSTLGYRFDQLPKLQNVPIHGQVLPTLADGSQLYIYTGNEHGYQLRNTNDFLRQDFEQFFDKQSNLGNSGQTSLLDKLFPKAAAHGSEHHNDIGHNSTSTELEAVNNLLGNVVIFAQQNKPADDQVKARFDTLVPLDTSTCGG